MANHASARKRIRQTLKRTERNKHVRTTVRTYIKRVRAAIAEGNGKQASELLRTAIQGVDRAVSKGVFHRRAGSRTIARLSHQVHTLLSRSV